MFASLEDYNAILFQPVCISASTLTKHQYTDPPGISSALEKELL
jgi:hypothetical protein